MIMLQLIGRDINTKKSQFREKIQQPSIEQVSLQTTKLQITNKVIITV